VKNYLTHKQVVALLRSSFDPSVPGNQYRFAEKLGVSPAYLCYVLSGRKPPYRKVLDYLGLIEVTRYKFTGPTMEGRLYARIEDHGTD
jgi:hypothetical protein